jgi:transcriptional regulator with XRE-family HTH domain
VRRTANAIAEGQTLGNVLILAMSRQGHTNHDAAVAIGTSRANIQQWANDLLDPWPENYDSLATYLGIEIDALGMFMIRTQVHRFQLRSQAALLMKWGEADH